MALDRFKQALAVLLDLAPSDPLERDEYFELNTLPSGGGSGFEVVICDEEHEIFAAIYTERLFDEGEAGQEEVEALVPASGSWSSPCRGSPPPAASINAPAAAVAAPDAGG